MREPGVFTYIGVPAGVDFPYLPYADQMGKRRSSVPGRRLAWAGCERLRDFPTVASDLWDGELSLSSYWSSLRNTRAESVFCVRDPLPSAAEVFMLPYLVTKKYFVKSGVKPGNQR